MPSQASCPPVLRLRRTWCWMSQIGRNLALERGATPTVQFEKERRASRTGMSSSPPTRIPLIDSQLLSRPPLGPALTRRSRCRTRALRSGKSTHRTPRKKDEGAKIVSNNKPLNDPYASTINLAWGKSVVPDKSQYQYGHAENMPGVMMAHKMRAAEPKSITATGWTTAPFGAVNYKGGNLNTHK